MSKAKKTKLKVLKKQVRIFIKVSGEPEWEIVGVTSFTVNTAFPGLTIDAQGTDCLGKAPVAQVVYGTIEFNAKNIIRVARPSRRQFWHNTTKAKKKRKVKT